jgi:hypothetical protein
MPDDPLFDLFFRSDQFFFRHGPHLLKVVDDDREIKDLISTDASISIITPVLLLC